MALMAALVANAGGVNTFKVVLLVDNPGPTTLSGVGIATKTKNPPYLKDAYDVWGLFKSDYIPVANNENLSRLTTKVSNMATDVWSLRKIKTNLGSDININYEGNTYGRSVLNKNKSIIVSSATLNSSGATMNLTVSNPTGADLSVLYRVGDKFDATMLFSRVIHKAFYGTNENMNDKKVIALSAFPPSRVASINGNVIQINVDPAVFTDLNDAAYVLTYAQAGTTVSSVTSTLLTANIKASATNINYGGGIRVKDIIVDDLNGHINKTSYNYNIPDFSGNPKVSSGVTSYEPVGLDIDNLYNFLNSNDGNDADVIKAYRRNLYKDLNYLFDSCQRSPGTGCDV